MTIEHYYRWYQSGVTGEPKCIDKTRIYDFSSTTLEHIYPRNKPASSKDVQLEPKKNALGNITFMGPADNVSGGNDDFPVKKPIFQGSSVQMNTAIGSETQWTVTELNNRQEMLKDIATKVFNI